MNKDVKQKPNKVHKSKVDVVEEMYGHDSNKYLHIKFSNAPFGYRPMDINDYNQALDTIWEEGWQEGYKQGKEAFDKDI